MIHIRIDQNMLNSDAQFLCGIGWSGLQPGDCYFFDLESRKAAFKDDPVCPGCYPNGKPQFGTPISKISGRPGHPGYEEFKRIAESWGYP